MVKQEPMSPTQPGKPRFYYGYVIVAASFIIQVIAFGMFNTFGIFFNPLVEQFGWTRATISGASSVRSLVMGAGSIAVGFLNDKFGPRIVMAACCLVFGVGHLLMSQVNTTWQLYLFYGLIVGVGSSGLDVVLLSTIARWFVKRRGMISGITKVGTGLGMLILPLITTRLISGYGWSKSYVILGFATLIIVVPITLFLKRDPAQIGQLPDGRGQVTDDSLNLPETGLSLQEALHTRQLWTLCATYLMIIFCAQTILIHIVPHAVDLGISMGEAAGVISTIGGVSMLGRLVMGGASDRIGNKRALIICFAVLVAALSWLQLATELWMLYLFAAIYGFCHGGFFALISPTIAGIFGTRSQGSTFGVIICGGMVGGAVGPLLAGYIFDTTQSYRIDFLILVAFSLIGLILAASLRPISKKESK